MSKRAWTGLVIAAAACAAILLTTLLVRSASRTTPPHVTVQADPDRYDTVPTADTLRASAARVAAAARREIQNLRGRGLPLPAGDALVEEVQGTLALYLGGSRDDFVAFVAERDRAPDDWATAPDSEVSWQQRVQAVQWAPVSAEGPCRWEPSRQRPTGRRPDSPRRRDSPRPGPGCTRANARHA